MSNELLSQDEIDALLHGVDSGAVDTDPPNSADPKVTITVDPDLVKVGDVTLHSGLSPPSITLQKTAGGVSVGLHNLEVRFQSFTATITGGSFLVSSQGFAGSLTASLTTSFASVTLTGDPACTVTAKGSANVVGCKEGRY